MKKTLIVAAVLSTIAGAAAAQSSVTLFGVVDVNARYVKNGDTKSKQLGTDGLNSSRLGFRGTEDLGGGLKASFWLESAVNPDTGTSNATRFWHRRSTVSLETPIGELRLGRDFSPTYTGISDYDVFSDNGVGSFSKLVSTLGTVVDTNTRADNQVSYFTPKTLGGFYGRLSVAASEGTLGKKLFGGRVGYANSALDVSGSYGTTEVTVAGDKYKVGAIGASYDFKVVKLLASVSQRKYLAVKENLYLIGAGVPIGSSGLFRASFEKANLSGGAAAGTADADDATLIALGYVHNLSKRTAVYGTVSRINNKGNQTFVTSATTPSVPAGGKSTGVEVGLRHSF